MTYTEFEKSGFDTSKFTKEKNFWGTNVIYLDENTRIKEGNHYIHVSETQYRYPTCYKLQRCHWFGWHTKVVILKETCKDDSMAVVIASLLKTEEYNLGIFSR